MTRFLICISVLFATTAFAQKVATSVDSISNKIGAEFKVTYTTVVDTAAKVVFPKAKSFGQLEVIRSYPIDTTRNGAMYTLVKKYGLTQFDSGKYTIPQIKILINQNTVLTDSLRVTVNPVAVDTLKQKMYDIKTVAKAKDGLGKWWKYLLAAIGFVLLGFLIYLLYKKFKRKPWAETVFKTPIEKATSLLQQLEQKQLWQKGEVKNYYSELTDIARDYIEEAIEIPAKESTTNELIIALRNASKRKKLNLTKETLTGLENVLRQADLVKFAKSKPLDYEIEEDRKRVENSIVTIHKSIPIEVDEEVDALTALQLETQRKKEAAKRKKRNIYLGIGAAVLLLLGTITVVGISAAKDFLFGNSTKEMLNGEWVYSEYGNPSVAIETPEVLVRTDISKSMPPEGMALIKSMQTFTYGKVLGDFYIGLSTVSFKSETNVDLEKAMEGSVQFLQTGGAQDIVLKQDSFTTAKGLEGRKGYGTFTRIDPMSKTSQKLYYEILIFGQNGGLQQVMAFYKEGDEYAAKIADRMLNSVELQIPAK